jgi:hypothetical protein
MEIREDSNKPVIPVAWKPDDKKITNIFGQIHIRISTKHNSNIYYTCKSLDSILFQRSPPLVLILIPIHQIRNNTSYYFKIYLILFSCRYFPISYCTQ